MPPPSNIGEQYYLFGALNKFFWKNPLFRNFVPPWGGFLGGRAGTDTSRKFYRSKINFSSDFFQIVQDFLQIRMEVQKFYRSTAPVAPIIVSAPKEGGESS